MSSHTPTTYAPKATSAQIADMWSTAGEFLGAATKFETCKLYAQAMAGMHLRDIQRDLGLGHGGDRSGASGQNGHLNFDGLCTEKLGISGRTARRLMEMGDALRKRLKKMPELKQVDVQSLSSLTGPQLDKLQTGVRKLTDGRTQVELMEALGLCKKGGASATGGARESGGDGASSLAERAGKAADIARTDWAALDLALRGYGEKFLSLDDASITAQLALLEIAVKSRRDWLAKPRAQRDPDAVKAYIAKALTGKI